MPKAVGPGTLQIQGVSSPVVANVPPDPFDARDQLYRPRLQMLEPTVDRRLDMHVLTQTGSSCTGHAVAAMINTVLAQQRKKRPYPRVSPYMLYYLARRYDEFPGEEDAGSSLRGVLKGWWRHGVALDREWPALGTYVDLDNAKLVRSCAQRPLGAYYRVDTQRLDDMQSAISELHAIVASATIHDGWRNPQPQKGPQGKINYVIRKTASSVPIGGHAFALVGYNEIGFLVQNSWGTSWGKGGYATLPYEDWLECAYDAWVARPGVPQTPFERIERTVSDTGQFGVAATPPPDVLRNHVLNLGNDGRLSTTGKATSSPSQLRAIIAAMRAHHAAWQSANTVIYLHGGLVSESSGLSQVQEQFQWWLNNHVYPIFIVWESGPMETVLDQLQDMIKRLPFGAGIQEGIDRLIEKTASTALAFAWRQMKQNAGAASDPLAALPANDADWFDQPGASLLMLLLQDYAKTNPLQLHILAHSAGAVFADGIVPRLKEYGVPVESLTFMAAASTVAAFDTSIRPHLCTHVKRLSNFTMSDDLELHDTCLDVYHKSLLYLVSRGFEQPANREVPLVGMQHFFTTPLSDGTTLQDAITKNCGSIVIASKIPPPNTPPDSVSTAQHHGDFHDDVNTMTSVLLRIIGQHTPATATQQYQPNASPTAPAGVALTVSGRTRPAGGPVVGRAAAVTGAPKSATRERRSKPRKERKATPVHRPRIER